VTPAPPAGEKKPDEPAAASPETTDAPASDKPATDAPAGEKPAQADAKKPEPEKDGAVAIGTEIVKSFDMDGESHTLTVTRTAQGISVVMASANPGQLRSKAETTLVAAREERAKLKEQLKGTKVDPALGQQKRDLDGLIASLDAFVKQLDAQTATDAEKPPTADTIEKQAVAMTSQLVGIGRTYRVPDLGSRQALQLPGFQHDRFIYETLVELANEVRANRGATPPPGTSPLQASLQRELGIGRAEYLRARAELNNLFPFHGHELFVDQRDGYVFPQVDVGENRAVLDGKVYAWAAEEARELTLATLQKSQPFRQQLHKEYGYPRTWTVGDMLGISRAVAEGTPIDKKQSALFIAAMVSEAERNLVAEVTNLLVLGDSDKTKKVFDQMPMTIGGTAPRDKDRTDPGLAGTNPKLPPGTVTDAEVDLAKRAYKDKTGTELVTMLDDFGASDTTRAHIKDTLRSVFVKLETAGG
jgi:hypothetical protein